MSFSIITTVLNGERFIIDCIESVQNQKYFEDVEHIIIDGGSEDNTASLIQDYSRKYKNINFRLEKNIGIYKGINIGLNIAQNEIIGILNSDDFYNDDQVFKNIDNEFQKNKEIFALHSNVKIFRRDNINKIYREYLSQEFLPQDYLNCYHPPHTSFFIKKSIYKKFGDFNENLKIASDFEFMLRVFGKNKVKSKFINKTFVCMRSHGTSTKNLKNIIYSNLEVVKSFKLNNLKISYFRLVLKIFRKAFQIRI